jgi:Flp pilus assembly protein TadB
MWQDDTPDEHGAKRRFRRAWRAPLLDMTVEGEFVGPQPAPLADRVMRVAIVVAAICSAVALAAVALYIAVLLIPLALAAALIAYLAFRWQLWRARRQLFGGQRGILDIFRFRP